MEGLSLSACSIWINIFHLVGDASLFNCLFASMQNPVSRWHICEGSINSIAFSSDGVYIATVGRDGIVIIWCLLSLSGF